MTILYTIIIFIFGSLFTSFFHVLATRLNNKESLLGRSHCDACNHELKLIEVFPIIGYIINKGKCRYCNEKIAINHLIYEIIGGALFASGYLLYDFNLTFWIYTILISVLIIESISDIKDMIVIDKIWMFGIIPILIIRIIENSILTYLISSMGLFLILLFIAFIAQKIFKKDALGGGDIKLYLFIGFFIPIQVGLLSIFLTSLFGLIYGIIFIKDRDKYIPLVPFISLAVIISFIYGTKIIDWYLTLIGM